KHKCSGELKYSFKRVISVPGIPAKIPRRYIIVDEDGREEPDAKQPPPHAGPQANVTEVLQQANSAAKTANEAATAALQSGLSLITTAASKSLEIVTKTVAENSPKGENSEVAALRQDVANLTKQLQDERTARLESQLHELREELRANRGQPSAT